MTSLNNNLFIKEVESVVENFVVMLNLLYDSKFTFKLHENRIKPIYKFNYEGQISEQDSDTYVMKIFIHDNEELGVTLDKDRFNSDIYFNKKLSDMIIQTKFGLANPNKTYWTIYGKVIDDLNKIIQVVDKLMSKKK